MKILFVCRANVGRSQVAQATFERLSRHESASAGTTVDEEVAEDPNTRRPITSWPITSRPITSLKVKDRSQHSLPYMQEHGIDIGERERTQLTPELVAASDKVVVIMPHDEWPDYLAASDRTIAWDLPDPGDMTRDAAWRIFDDVRERVRALVEEIG